MIALNEDKLPFRQSQYDKSPALARSLLRSMLLMAGTPTSKDIGSRTGSLEGVNPSFACSEKDKKG